VNRGLNALDLLKNDYVGERRHRSVIPRPRGVAAVLLALMLVVAGVPAGALAATVADATVPVTDVSDEDGPTSDETDAVDSRNDTDGSVDSSDRSNETVGSTNGTEAVDSANGTDGTAAGSDDGSVPADAEAQPDDGSGVATLTYRGVEYTVPVPVPGGDDDAVATSSVDASPFGAPVDGDRYLVHVVLVDDDPVHEASLEELGAEVHLRVGRDVEVLATLQTVEELRAAPFVETVKPVVWLRSSDPVDRSIDRSGLSAELRTATGTVRAAATDGPVVSEGVARIGADRAHARGITGDGVAVGIVGTGFDPANPEYAANLVEYRRFSTPNDDGSVHGVGVTEIVVDVAPDARIYYAEVRTELQWVAAVDWMIANDVDVVTSSFGAIAGPFDGSSIEDRAVDRAADAGIVPVVLTHNWANSHWEGPGVDADGDGFQEFDAEGNEVLTLNDGQPLPPVVTFGIWLMWDDWTSAATDDDYAIGLYQVTPEELEFLGAVDLNGVGSPEPLEGAREITLTGVAHPVVVAVLRIAGDEPRTLEINAVDVSLLETIPAGSITEPATARSAIAVGAYDQRSGQLTDYSGQGPTNDGRRGVDVIAPSHVATTAYGGYDVLSAGFTGTSSATPHVAGVAALVLQADPSLSPADVERILTETATDTGVPGPDTATGFGYVDAYAAVQVGLGETPAVNRAPPSSDGPTGEWTLLLEDPDESDLDLDLAAVWAQHDADTLYLRSEFHGDYRPDGGTLTSLFVDADRDPTTGAFFEPFGIGVSRAALGDPDAVDVAGGTIHLPVGGETQVDLSPDSGAVTYAFDDAVPDPDRADRDLRPTRTATAGTRTSTATAGSASST
jgi:subtilisin family serine protease